MKLCSLHSPSGSPWTLCRFPDLDDNNTVCFFSTDCVILPVATAMAMDAGAANEAAGKSANGGVEHCDFTATDHAIKGEQEMHQTASSEAHLTSTEVNGNDEHASSASAEHQPLMTPAASPPSSPTRSLQHNVDRPHLLDNHTKQQQHKQRKRPQATLFSFRFAVPPHAPPSFRGVVARYQYLVSATVTLSRAIPTAAVSGSWGSGMVGLWGSLTRTRTPSASSLPLAPSVEWAAAPEEHTVHVPFAVLSSGRGGGGRSGVANTAAHPLQQQQQRRQSNAPATAAASCPTLPPPMIWASLVAQPEQGSGGSIEDQLHCSSEHPQHPDDLLEVGSSAAVAPSAAAAAMARTHVSVWDLQGRLRHHDPSSGSGGGGSAASPLVFAIRSGDARVLRFILHRRELSPGDLILGTFDMSGADAPCHQICACLVVEERAATAWSAAAVTAAAIAASTSTMGNSSAAAATAAAATAKASEASQKGVAPLPPSPLQQPHQRIVDVFHALGADVRTTTMTLALPPDASLSFASDLVEVRWLLRFEFTVGAITTITTNTTSLPSHISETTPRGTPRSAAAAMDSKGAAAVSAAGTPSGSVHGASSAAVATGGQQQQQQHRRRTPSFLAAGGTPALMGDSGSGGGGSSRSTAADAEQQTFSVLRWEVPIAVVPPPIVSTAGAEDAAAGALQVPWASQEGAAERTIVL